MDKKKYMVFDQTRFVNGPKKENKKCDISPILGVDFNFFCNMLC